MHIKIPVPIVLLALLFPPRARADDPDKSVHSDVARIAETLAVTALQSARLADLPPTVVARAQERPAQYQEVIEVVLCSPSFSVWHKAACLRLAAEARLECSKEAIRSLKSQIIQERVLLEIEQKQMALSDENKKLTRFADYNNHRIDVDVLQRELDSTLVRQARCGRDQKRVDPGKAASPTP